MATNFSDIFGGSTTTSTDGTDPTQEDTLAAGDTADSGSGVSEADSPAYVTDSDTTFSDEQTYFSENDSGGLE